MSKEPKKTREPTERSQFIEDAILRETVKMEKRFHKDYTVFQPSLESLKEATPDKPLVSSFCSSKRDEDINEEDQKMLKTLHMDTISEDPKKKYKFPLTTSQEIGWDAYDYKPKSIFNHRHHSTDITTTPTHYDPLAGQKSSSGTAARGKK